MKLLIIEDEPELMQVMKEPLEKNNFLTETDLAVLKIYYPRNQKFKKNQKFTDG